MCAPPTSLRRSPPCESNTQSKRTKCLAAMARAAPIIELGEEGLFVLETNTPPGMTPLSLVPEQARHAGIDYASLVDLIVKEALRVHAEKGCAHG